MSSRLVNVDRTTPMLLPPDLREWVQNDDLAHFIVDALALVDVSGASLNHRGTGSEQYPPSMMLGVLIYCYANGIFSSRQIERATYQHLSVRYLAANTHPDHDTIATFRHKNGALISRVFVQLLQLARRSGLLKVGVVALDGTKIEANASKRKTLQMSKIGEELRALDERVGELLAQAQIADQRDDRSDELPAQLADAQQRRTRLLAAKAQLEAQVRARHAQREAQRDDDQSGDKPRKMRQRPLPTDTINPTDPDSMVTPAQQRYIQGYNAQLVISAQNKGLIMAADVVRQANDLEQLEPMIEEAVRNVGKIDRVLVDTGYDNFRQIQAVERKHGVEVLCPPAANAQARAEAVSRSPWRRWRKAKRQEMRQQLASPEGRRLYALRKTTVEPAIGIIKNVLGFVRFSLRGLKNVKTEWLLIALAFNCRRLAAAAA